MRNHEGSETNFNCLKDHIEASGTLARSSVAGKEGRICDIRIFHQLCNRSLNMLKIHVQVNTRDLCPLAVSARRRRRPYFTMASSQYRVPHNLAHISVRQNKPRWFFDPELGVFL